MQVPSKLLKLHPVTSAGKLVPLYSTKRTRNIFIMVYLFAFFYISTEVDHFRKSDFFALFSFRSFAVFYHTISISFLRTVSDIFLRSEMMGLPLLPIMLFRITVYFVGDEFMPAMVTILDDWVAQMLLTVNWRVQKF